MTKEELRNLFCKQLNSSQHWGDLSLFDEFFDSNVCILKGENRHPYADVLHEWIEGVDCQWGYEKSNSNEWYEDMQVTNIEGKKYRIKPSEPVYEWYCLYKPTLSNEWRPNGYMSQSEIMEWKSQHGDTWSITYVDNTKRERK